MTVSEKIDKGAATLWDLTENKDELSKYGQAMQEEIIKESVENTNFNYHDENGSNLLHILAASNSPLDDMMIGGIRASHLSVFVHMLNEKDNDGRTPVDDMVENHGFEVKVDPEYGVIPEEFSHTADNEFGHDSGHDHDGCDAEFGDIDIGDDPGGDIDIDF